MSRARRDAAGGQHGGRWTRRHAVGVVSKWVASGESGASFARKLGVDPQRLFWWRRRIEEVGAESEPPVARPAFLPVVAAPSIVISRPPIAVTMVDGTRVEVWELDAASAGWVASMIDGGRHS
jgi:hypothetical protein